MDAADFFGQVAPPASAPEASTATAAAVEAPPEPVEPVTVYMDTTPSGIVVEYQAKPKRLYRVNGVEVPSVTTVLGVLDKPALMWWGMKVGVTGTIELFDRGQITAVIDQAQGGVFKTVLKAGALPASVETVVPLLNEHKLTVNHVRDGAADRGVNVHDAFETWAATGQLPDPEDFPETERGYVEGLCQFLVDADPEPAGLEIMVGSEKHGYAGRYDARLIFNSASDMVVHRTPKRGEQRQTIDAGTFLCDLKTSKDVYPFSHFRQLEAYEEAGIECGYDPTDGRYVIHVDEHGNYKFVRSYATFDDFLAVLRVHQSNERIKAAKP